MSDIPDKQHLYGRYQKSEDWRQQLQKKLTHKSLDIPEDDDVYVDNSNKGMGWKELAVISGTLLGAGALYAYSNSTPQTPPTAVAPPAQPAGPVDSEYQIRFFDKDGNLIEVPHISQRADQ